MKTAGMTSVQVMDAVMKRTTGMIRETFRLRADLLQAAALADREGNEVVAHESREGHDRIQEATGRLLAALPPNYKHYL